MTLALWMVWLKVPDDVLFLWNGNPSCDWDWDRAISLDFGKYVAKGVIGDLSCRSALHHWCKLYFPFRSPGDSEQTPSRGRRPRLLQGSQTFLCSWGKDWLLRSFIQDVKILFAFPWAPNREWNCKQNMPKNIGSETHRFRPICQIRRTNERRFRERAKYEHA